MKLNLERYRHLLNESWRIHPSALAHHLSNGEFVRYPHIDKISQTLASAIVKGGARIILSTPPRHGKSYLISRWVPAWFLSLYPHKKVILASYEAAFAATWGRQVRNILQETPALHVIVSGDSHAADRWDTTEGGGMFTAGIGGPLTGRGADCLSKENFVELNINCYKSISEIKQGDYVQSFNHQTRQKELKQVIATRKLKASQLVRIKTIGGREIISTPDHPIYRDQFGYKKAHFLRERDRLVTSEISKEQILSDLQKIPRQIQSTYLPTLLFQSAKSRFKTRMSFLQKGILKNSIRIREIIAKRTQRFLLLPAVLKTASCIQKSEKMSHLLYSVSLQIHGLLFPKMRSKQKNNALFRIIQKTETLHLGTRFQSMLRLLHSQNNSRSSHRYGSEKRSNRKFDNALQSMSFQTSSIGSDHVSSVERLGREEVDVYDLQVEGNHNFFANGILVHNCLLIDDYVKNAEEADSPTYQRRAIEWWNTTFRTRAEPGASIIILATRWHQNDLIGYLTSENNENRDEWTVINLPAISDSIDDWMGRKVGEALCPERFDLQALEDIKRSVGTRSWNALYQGAPTPASGGLFTADMFEFVELPESFDYQFITADTAYNDKRENDFTVFTAFGVIQDRLYILDVFRKQIKAAEVEQPAIGFIKRFSAYNFRGAYIEPKGHGIYLNQILPRRGVLIPSELELKEFYSDRKFDKVARANNAAPHLAYRKVFMNRHIHDKEALVAEVLTFPRAKFDDFTDCFIDGVKYAFNSKLSICDVY